MNYLTLVMRIKYPNQAQLQIQIKWINPMYYGFGALNFFLPIIFTALIGKSPGVSFWLSLILNIIWIFTVAVLFVALSIIKRSLSAESRVAVNVMAMTTHFIAFAIYAVESIYAMASQIMYLNHPDC